MPNWLFSHDVSRIILDRYPSQKYSFPATSQSEIGWPWYQKNTKEKSKNKKGKSDPGFYSFESGYNGVGDV